MNEFKILVTGGCSFSECVNWYRDHNPDNRTWPVHLAELTGLAHYSEGMGSQGNGLISRRTMYRVHKLLETNDPRSILVGVMWTGRDRFDFYFENPIEFSKNVDGWMENPTRVVDDASGGWVICNPHWTHDYNAPWYRYYYNEIASQIYTLEHIVNLQNFLKLRGVRYFMTSSFATHINSAFVQNPNCQWLYDQIDQDQWLPIESQRHWILENCPNKEYDNFHPHSWQHGAFTHRCVIPWLEKKFA